MGRDKALLPLGTGTFVERLLEVLDGVVSPIVVVLGHHAGPIEHAITPVMARTSGARVVRNADYRLGQLSSLQAALRTLAGERVAGALVCLVDHPAIPRSVVAEMVARFRAAGAPILIPSHQSPSQGRRRGHPVLFAARLFPELLAAPPGAGARAVVNAHASEIVYVETDEEAVLWDIDRPEDYEKLIERWRS